MYYTLKCVHCMSVIKQEDIVFKAVLDELEDYEEVAAKSKENDERDDSETNSESTSFPMEDNSDIDISGMSMGGMGKKKRKKSSKSIESVNNAKLDEEYRTIKSIYEQVGKENIKALTEDVHIPKAVYKDEFVRDGLITGLCVDGLYLEGKYYKGTLKTRRCPYCHKILLRDAGKLPIFLLGLFGHTTAGKTVFLTMQCFLSVKTKKLALDVPNGRLTFISEKSHLERGEVDTIIDSAEKFKSTGLFPATTQELPPPHCLMVSYRQGQYDANGSFKNSGSDTTTCYISFQDIKGELLGAKFENSSDDKDFRTVVDFFKKVDGIMVFTDPFALNPPTEEADDSINVHRVNDGDVVVDQMLTNFIDHFIENRVEAIQTPTVCILTKEDALYKCALENRIEGLSITSPTLAPGVDIKYNPKYNWSNDVLRKISDSTQQVVSKLDKSGNWTRVLEDMFTGAIHIPISSIGSDVSIITLPEVEVEGKKAARDKLVDHDQRREFNALTDEQKSQKIDAFLKMKSPVDKVKSRFIELPILYFLMVFGMIPPLHENDYFKADCRLNNQGMVKKLINFFKSQDKEREILQKSLDDHYKKWLEDHKQN